MGERVVVLGAGYAGCVAIQRLERELDDDASLTWISAADHHLVRHEVHRAIADPGVGEAITIPVSTIKSAGTRFVRDRVTGLDVETRRVELADGEDVPYDYALVALGSDTAFYGIPGLAERAHTLEGLRAAVGVHEAATAAGRSADRDDPARIVVAGAGLSGVQSAGELASLRDREALPLRVTLVEALPEILPGGDPGLQRRIRDALEGRGVEVITDSPITGVEPAAVDLEGRGRIEHDVLLWTAGITGRRALEGTPLPADHRRLRADPTFRTGDDRVFAVGDAAVVDLDGGAAPPTAQAAWDGGQVAAANLARAIQGRPLRRWTYREKGTLVSIGSDAIAHDVLHVPIETFGGPAAVLLKKLVAAQWIATVASRRRALAAWDAL